MVILVDLVEVDILDQEQEEQVILLQLALLKVQMEALDQVVYSALMVEVAEVVLQVEDYLLITLQYLDKLVQEVMEQQVQSQEVQLQELEAVVAVLVVDLKVLQVQVVEELVEVIILLLML